jgi:feruloyl esterase
MRTLILVSCLFLQSVFAFAEVTRVKVTARTVVADGQSFGSAGPYERLVGRIEFAIDPTDARNAGIVDLQLAPRGPDGRVRFESDLYVLRPVDASRGNGVLFFEIANRGRKGLLTRFNSASGADDPTSAADFGDGLLMREGYTLVWVGWEFDVAPTLIKVDAPIIPVHTTRPLRVSFIVNERQNEAALTDAPLYPPADPSDGAALLTVRDSFLDVPTIVARDRWRFVSSTGAPRVALDGGFEPGRLYELTYRANGRRVAGVGFAAIRDAASAFRSRTDLPVAGKQAYVFGASQSGRFLRDFLHQGFNVDERGRQVFDAMWPHIAGSAGGSFNETFATPTSLTAFRATRFPFADLSQREAEGVRDGLLERYPRRHWPKIFYTNTSVEYWGLGRAAALSHVSVATQKDVEPPQNVRIYLLAGTQHGESPFPPSKTGGQELGNPVPQREVMRALLRALDQWVRNGATPPASRYPRRDDQTLVRVRDIRFPRLAGVGDPRTITGPARFVGGDIAGMLPFLVPQVDADGNEIAGIRVPDLAVPLATTTGWNFRSQALGNPGDIVALMGSYIPFPLTEAERDARRDPRVSVGARYRNRDDYLGKIRASASDLMKQGYLLAEDQDKVVARANAHWDYATRDGAPAPSGSCEGAAALALPNAVITLAERVPAGGFTSPNDTNPDRFRSLPAFCRIAATLKPTTDSEIKIETWLPASGWNGKFQAVGNGAFFGTIAYPALAAALARGYAVSSTDTGHAGGSASFGLGHPEKVIDFGWRAVHEMTVASKQIVSAHYGRGPRLSYWTGCSAGGRQGLKAAQRFPGDFDGIVAGAPGLDWTGRAAQATRFAKSLEENAAARLLRPHRELLHRAVVEKCDHLDGVKDGVLENPAGCSFDPAILQCKGETAEDSCLSAAQVETARQIYAGAPNPKTRRAINGLAPGSEMGWTDLGWTASARATGLDQFRFLVFGDTTWNVSNFSFDADIVRAEERDAGIINALDPDLKPFLDRGGKLIQYHGWSDPQISAGDSIQYYERVVDRLGGRAAVDRAYRLFMAPGMGHCGGGDGPNTFDTLTALEEWVEQGKAPDQIPASLSTNGQTVRTRPLCPYPQVAAYRGTGSTDEAASFVCRVP